MSLLARHCSSGKIAYPTRGAAKQAALNYALRDTQRLGSAEVNTVYRCPECSAWHRTHRHKRRAA